MLDKHIYFLYYCIKLLVQMFTREFLLRGKGCGILDWQLDNERPVYAQLVQQIEQAVASGVFAPGQKLPGVRELAAEAGVNPNTMQRALAQLEETGLLRAQRTSGRFVTQDTCLIRALRAGAALEMTRRWAAGMKALGCTRQEAEEYLHTVWEE